MPYDPQRHHRRSIRLRGYDYTSSGAYFVTICTSNRECNLSRIYEDEVWFTPYGTIVSNCWHALPKHYQRVRLDAFVIMPNHFHGILWLEDVSGDVKPHSLSEIVRGFKAFSTRQVNVHRHVEGVSLWQRNYYERIVRNEVMLNQFRRYIYYNPARWWIDKENPANF